MFEEDAMIVILRQTRKDVNQSKREREKNKRIQASDRYREMKGQSVLINVYYVALVIKVNTRFRGE